MYNITDKEVSKQAVQETQKRNVKDLIINTTVHNKILKDDH